MHATKSIPWLRAFGTAFGLLWLIGVAPCHAADVRPFIKGSGDYRLIVIEGRIEPGDYERFVRIVRENQGQVSGVFVFSLGGDFDEAMKIGRAMRILELSSQVPMRSASGNPSCLVDDILPYPNDAKNCNAASAAFFIHIGGVHRGGNYLAVHRPVPASNSFGNLSQVQAQAAFDALQAKAREYMQEMGVPVHIQEDVLGTPSDRTLLLDDKTIKTHFWGTPAYRHEWIKNKCSRMTDAERTRSEEFSRRLLRPRDRTEANFSRSELDEMRVLRSKEDEERECASAIAVQARTDAYEKFFGVKPSDHAGQDFARWAQAANYLGKQFYEVVAEERFEDVRSGKFAFLKRSATASSPYLSLSDMGSRPRVVGWINLVSTPNPSPEFIRLLVKSLENAWGKPTGGNGADEWRWERKEYSARLHHEPRSSTGPFVSLVIEAK